MQLPTNPLVRSSRNKSQKLDSFNLSSLAIHLPPYIEEEEEVDEVEERGERK
jgi:hypothetical protein